MTVSAQTPYNVTTANGVSTVFPYQFKILAGADLQVFVAGVLKALTIDYTVTGVGADVGGSVIFTVAPAASAIVSIIRVMTVKRTTDYQQLGDFLTPVVNPDFDNAILLIQDAQTQIGRSIRTPADEVGTLPTLPSIADRAGKFIAFDVSGQPIASAGTGADAGLRTDLADEASGGNRLVAIRKTPEEITAGVTIVNKFEAVGCWDRYGNNATPGTTDMSAAASAAYSVARLSGCIVTYGRTAPYRFNSPVNCTNLRGTITRDLSGKNQSSGVAPSVIIAHTGHGFDLSASNETSWHDMVPTNLAGTVPKDVWFIARNAAASGAEFHHFHNCRTPSNCTFEQISYLYGSEAPHWVDCVFYNSRVGSTIHHHNSTNPLGYSSTFLTIATGPQSSSLPRHMRCEYFNQGNAGGAKAESIFILDGAANFSFKDGLWYLPNGKAYIRTIGTQAINWLTVDDIRGEPHGGTKPDYAVSAETTTTTGGNKNVQWTFKNVYADIAQEFLFLGDQAHLETLVMLAARATSGKLFSVHTLTNSIIEHGTSTCVGRGTGSVSGCNFFGARGQLTFSGTDSANCGLDQTNGELWQTGDSSALGAAACTGAITASATWTARKAVKTVTLSLPSISAVATAAASFTFGQVLPAAYRPASNRRFHCIISDNGNVLNQPGFVFINAATGAISVFKDVVGTANFTAAAGAGLSDNQCFSWTVP